MVLSTLIIPPTNLASRGFSALSQYETRNTVEIHILLKSTLKFIWGMTYMTALLPRFSDTSLSKHGLQLPILSLVTQNRPSISSIINWNS